jgi:putative ABC transport system permease protein
VARTVKYDDPKEFNQAWFWADGKLDFFARQLLGTHKQADSGAWLLLAIIGTLMLLFMALPALNLINLNTGRILERSAEIGVRKAFGASSRQLVWQFVVENVLLCIVGGVLGLGFAMLALRWLEGSGLIPYLQVDLDLAVFGWGLLLAVVFGLLSGVVPAWKMSRLHPVQALKGDA